jgi:hypothetical protein
LGDGFEVGIENFNENQEFESQKFPEQQEFSNSKGFDLEQEP